MTRSPHKKAASAALLLALIGRPLAGASRPSFSLAASGPALFGGAPEAGFSLAPRPGAAAAPAAAAQPAETTMPRKTRRAIVQLSAVAIYSTVRYWSDYHRWIEDWQYELTCADQYRRFLTTEAIRFDSNNFVTNWTHVFAGVLYYQFARTNSWTWEQSLLASTVGSAFYEYISEWREVISINDMFNTSFGAYELGEPVFQITDYFHHQKSPVLRALGFLNPVNELNHWLDRKKPASKVYVAPGWHAFALTAGWWRSGETGRRTLNTGLVGFDGQIIFVPEYGRPGEVRKKVRTISLAEFAFEGAFGRRPAGEEDLSNGFAEEIDLFGRVVGLAWYRQKIDALGRGDVLSIGLGSALSYLRKRPTLYDSRKVQVHIDPPPETPTDFRDKYAINHLAGPVIDWTHFGRGFKLRAVADAYLDFALMSSFAFNAYSAVHSIEGQKTTMSYFGYAYSLGGSASVRVDLDWGNLWLRGLASVGAWDSLEGRDRFEAELTNDLNVVDTKFRCLAKAGWRLPGTPVRAVFS
ncbi:MAG TPA: DUF3943 domain-containing protein, partial [Acidobacteriota bacterium]|nr:DUF3943 domain-containing protein [Acidobacteriota bacterium]